MGIEDWPIALAEETEQPFDVCDRAPSDVAAGGRKLLDRFPERLRCRAHGAVLHVDDQQGGPRAKTGAPAKAGRVIGALLVLGNDAVPGPPPSTHRLPPSLAVA